MTLMEMLMRPLMLPAKRRDRLGITRYPFLGGAAWPH